MQPKKTGKLYCIRSYKTDEIYIGSTMQKYISQRFGDHLKHYRKYLRGERTYISSFKIIELGDAYVELIEDCGDISVMELRKKEGEKIRDEKNCVNKYIAGRSQREYVEENIEKLKEYKKDYYCENRDKIMKRSTEYNKKNNKKRCEKIKCVCGVLYSKANKNKHVKTQKHMSFLNAHNQ